jgi:hypothetical protein
MDILELYVLNALPKLSGNVIFVFSKEERNNKAQRRNKNYDQHDAE